MNKLKLASWNLCLGLANKKDYIAHTLRQENIDICGLQECEVNSIVDEKHLTIGDYHLELEENDQKRRVGVYIKNTVDYVRRKDLETKNFHLVIIDINNVTNYRLITLYRSFASQNNSTPTERFIKQLEIIRNALSNCYNRTPIIIGDFNLDYSKIYNPTYGFRNLFERLSEFFEPFGLQQLINFHTWSRTVNGQVRSSLLDHIYTTAPHLISDINQIETEIGDHKLIMCDIHSLKSESKTIMKRDWRHYSKHALVERLKNCNFNTSLNCVQETWNRFENIMINIVDELTPLVPFCNESIKNSSVPKNVKNLINMKKRFLKILKTKQRPDLQIKIKALNKEIKFNLKNLKTKKVRQGIIPGNSKTLWNAVKKAKDLNISSIPDKLTLNSVQINTLDVPDAFAEFFSNKIKDITQDCEVDSNVYNGKRKVFAENQHFMSPADVLNSINSLKIKNCEGFDRIPVRYLVDGSAYLISIFSHLFNLIYTTRKIPEQWRISKIMPIFKKGSPNKIENYRPVSNLCSASKIFEKLILNRLTQIEDLSKISLTGKSQHGFKKNHSTATLGLTIQSIITKALDNNNFALMASLDLSSAFDVVNVKLLIKRLNIIGIPSDVVSLIETWLSRRHFYVSIDDSNSCLISSDSGTIQGSILGPVLYAIYVSPLFDIQKLSNYADDNFVIRWNKCVNDLINEMQQDLEAMIKWLRQSGLKVNESKTEMCLFHRSEVKIITLNINNTLIKTTPQINVLGVIFDSKLQWNEQVSNTIKKANKALQAIRLIKNHFNLQELTTLLTSNFYSILYYNSEIWHIPALKPYLKNLILAASSKALKICDPYCPPHTSYLDLHSKNLRATPAQFLMYKHSLLLYNVYNNHTPPTDWMDINFNQNFNSRDQNFRVFNNSNYKVGKNKISERLCILNGKIPLEWLNLEKDTFKINCKLKFLPQKQNIT